MIVMNSINGMIEMNGMIAMKMELTNLVQRIISKPCEDEMPTAKLEEKESLMNINQGALLIEKMIQLGNVM